MLVSYNILKKFVTPPGDMAARELANILTMSTVEVEDWVDQAQALDKVVVGLVKAVKSHPNADKLKLAAVDIGRETLEVVCGGVNLKQGMKVALAQVGARVRWHGEGDWITLTKATIRGVESNGMACAAEELGLPDSKAVAGGIMDLSHLKATPGTPLAQALEQADIILDIDNKSITHRPDLWGHLGLARELAAIWKKEFKLPAVPKIKPGNGVKLSVTISAPDKAQRYLGVVVSRLKIEPSPAWLVQTLNGLGMRPINNVVDVTNYVMLELGQPLHAFDLKKLASPEIIVRTAKAGEKITTLDGVERKLSESMLVIADKHQAQAIAGVMGGSTSEVSESTTEIVLESATFEAVGIRKTAQALGLRTEASARFEKALDPNLAELALRRAVQLFKQVAPSCKVTSNLAEAYPTKLVPKPILLSLDWLGKKLGVDLPVSEVKDILQRLGFAVSGTAKQLKVTPPTWRATRDITIPEDLVEEVARIHGYGKIPLSMPKFDITPPARDGAQELRWKIRDLLVGAGWIETLSYSFVGIEAQSEYELVNPVDQTKKFLRPSLVATLQPQFEAIKRSDEGKAFKIFELGRVFKNEDSDWLVGGSDKSDRLPAQPWHLALAVYDPQGGALRLAKGAFQAIQELLGLNLAKVSYPMISANAVMVELSLDDNNASLVFEPVFKPLAKYPSVQRDFSIVVLGGTAWEQISKAVQGVSPVIESIEVFDVYPQKGSIAFRLTFRSPDRTLKSEEVDAIVKQINQLLINKFKATIR